jgi:hypothetical protein
MYTTCWSLRPIMQQKKATCFYVELLFMPNATCHVISVLNIFSKLNRWRPKFVWIIFKTSIPQCVAITMTNQFKLLGKQFLFILRTIRNTYSQGKMQNSFMLKQVAHTITTVLNNKPQDLFCTAIKMCFATLHQGCLAYFVINSLDAHF